MTPSILQADVFTALRGVIITIVSCPVIRSQTNRVPMPVGPFVVMTQTAGAAMETNTDTWTATEKTVLRPEQFTVQIDCYGAGSGDSARMIAALMRDSYACELMAAVNPNIQPLYAGDAKQMPLIDGEQQYEERWTFEVQLQINPTFTVAQQSANALTVDLLNVDRTYPPQ